MSSNPKTRSSAARRALGDHLRRLRQMGGWTLHEIADRVTKSGVPVSHATISRVELGQTAVTADLLVVLGETLGADFGTVEEIMRVSRRKGRIPLEKVDVDHMFDSASSAALVGDYFRALDWYQAARDKLLETGESTDRDQLPDGHYDQLAEAMLYEAECHRRLRQYSLSVDLAGRVLNMPDRPVEQRFRALLLHVQWGYQVESFYQAELFAREAESLLDQVEPKLQALGRGVLAAMSYKLDRWGDAAARFKPAIELYRELGQEVEVARMGVSMGYSMHRSGDDGGFARVHDSLRLAQKNGHDDVATFAHLALGRIEADRENFDDSAEHFSQAAAMAKDLGLNHEEFIAWFDHWNILKQRQDASEAAKLKRRLSRLVKKIDRRLPEAQAFLRATSRKSRPGTTHD